MPRHRRTPFLVHLRMDWKEFRGKVRRRIAFSKIRFKRFTKALKARRDERMDRNTASSQFPKSRDVHYRSYSRSSKIQRLRAHFFSDLKEARGSFKQKLHLKWMRLKRFFLGTSTRMSDLPSAKGFTKYLLRKRRRNLRKQRGLSTRKAEAKASSWHKLFRVHLPEWFRRWTTNKKPLSVLFAFTLLVGLGFSVIAAPLYDFLKKQRAEQLLERSRELHGEGLSQSAFRKAHASYMLNPHPIDTLRWLCEIADSIGYHELLSWRQKVVDDPQSKPKDRIKLIRAALSLNHHKLATEMISGLREGDVDPVEHRYLLLLTTLTQGRAAKSAAIMQCREILSYSDAPLEAYRIYWSLCLDSFDPRFGHEAVAHMEKTATLGGERGLVALCALLQLPEQEESKRQLHAKMLWEHPLAKRHDLLLSLRAVYFGKPLPETALRAALGKQYDRLDDADLKAIAATLNDLGLHENAANLLPLRTMADQKELWVEWLRARFGSDQTQEAKRVLHEETPFSESERRFLHSLLLRKDGASEEADRELLEALRLAQASDLPILRQFCLLHEDKDTLIALLHRLAKEPSLERWARALLVLTLQRGVEDEPLEELLSSMQPEDYQKDPETANRVSRLKVLHGQDLIACRKIAESLVTHYPHVREYRFTLALCYQESNRQAESLRLLQGMLSSNPSECPTQRLIGARALIRNGFPNEAKELLDGLENINLLSAELRILEDVLAQTENKQKTPNLP